MPTKDKQGLTYELLRDARFWVEFAEWWDNGGWRVVLASYFKGLKGGRNGLETNR